MSPTKAKGYRGSWYADLVGSITAQRVPVVFEDFIHWKGGLPRFVDSGFLPGNPQYSTQQRNDFVDAIKDKGMVILTGPHKEDPNLTWVRSGYIAVFEVGNVGITVNGLEFNLTRRLVDL